MFGLPGQTMAQWETTLGRAIALEPSHISTYCLTYEEDTEFLRRHTEGEFRSDPEADADFFNLADSVVRRGRLLSITKSRTMRDLAFNRSTTGPTGVGTITSGLGPSVVSTPSGSGAGRIFRTTASTVIACWMVSRLRPATKC